MTIKVCPVFNTKLTKPKPDAMTTAAIPETAEKTAYRNYAAPQVSETFDTVREFYRLNHRHQTHDFVIAKKAEFLSFNRQKMTPWAALDYLNTLVDDSDPDTALPQIDHLAQTAEAMRADGQPEWMVLTGFIHDLGKVLCLFGEPQWADQDRAMLPWVQKFNPYDLYSKNPNRPTLAAVKPYYEDLLAKYLPENLQF